jgi:hypothetical protein
MTVFEERRKRKAQAKAKAEGGGREQVAAAGSRQE